MFEFIKKEDRARYGAIALILVFIFSTAAIYMNSGFRLSGGAGVSSPGPNAPTPSIDTFNGTASANATLVSWDPSLVVVGSSPDLDALVQSLKDQNIVTYDLETADGRILRLASGAYVFNLTQEVTALNLTAYADGVLSLPDVRVTGSGIEKTVPGSTFRYNTVPVFEQGDTFPVSFSANVVNGQLVSLGNLRIDAGAPVRLQIVPLNQTLNATFWRVNVPWESRGVNYNQLQANLPGGSYVTYNLRSYVEFGSERCAGAGDARRCIWNATPLDPAYLNALGARTPAYAVSLQPGLMGVNLNMTNRSQVAADLTAFGLKEYVHPNETDTWLDIWALCHSGENANQTGHLFRFAESPMDIRGYRYPNETDEKWLSRTQGVFNQTFPGLVLNFTTTYRLWLTLPPTVGMPGGPAYMVTNRTLALNSLYPPMENGTVQTVFTPVGRRVVQFDQAEYLPRIDCANQPLLNTSG